jgi:amino acid transporter
MPDGPRRDAAARGIAIGVVTFSCLIHGTCRRGGILLNNIIASTKVLILFIFPVLAICALAGVGNTNNATMNMSIKNSFAGVHTNTSMYGWSNAFLSVLYAYSGFNQANYVSS